MKSKFECVPFSKIFNRKERGGERSSYSEPGPSVDEDQSNSINNNNSYNNDNNNNNNDNSTTDIDTIHITSINHSNINNNSTANRRQRRINHNQSNNINNCIDSGDHITSINDDNTNMINIRKNKTNRKVGMSKGKIGFADRKSGMEELNPEDFNKSLESMLRTEHLKRYGLL